MKSTKTIVITIVLLAISAVVTITLIRKYSFTEEMARNYANRFFNILKIKESNKEFDEVYPSFGSTSARVISRSNAKINSITKLPDGNFEIYANWESNQLPSPTLYLIINRDGKIVNSKGISYAYYDKTFEYAKKLGCINGSEYDSEVEQIIDKKSLRVKLNAFAELEASLIKNNIKITGRLTKQYGSTSGTIVISNNTPYRLSFTDLNCSVRFFNSNGTIVDTHEISFVSIDPYASESDYVYSGTESSSKYEVVKEFNPSSQFKNIIKEVIIQNTTDNCE